MRHLTQNTLVDIARHSNKTLKLANFMVQAGYSFLYSEMARVGKTTPAIEAIEAFNKDIDKTATQMGQVHELLSTVDENGYVAHLKNDEKNLKTIFGDAYDPKGQTITFNSCTLSLKKPFSKQQVADDILRNTVGQSFSEFKDMHKRRHKVFSLDDQSLYTDEDKIYFLSIVKNREEYKKSLVKIREYGQGFNDYRKDLSLSEKNQIDNEITFNRSMIDSVAKNSTYATKEDGAVQLSSAHKKEPQNIKKLVNFLSNNEFIRAVELDNETSLEAVLDVLNKTKSINFNLDEEVVFKARKLGNYNANGLYMDNQRIVAVDIKNPSALIHEFVHAVDLGRSNIFHSQQREDIANKFRAHINDEELDDSKRAYYLRTEEIIARLGEVGYVLNQFDYQPEESMEDFKKRVEKEQESDDPYDLNVAKPISTYLNSSANIYFNIRDMGKDDLMEVKSYYQSYFGVENDDIKPINFVEVDRKNKESKVIGKRLKHELKPISFFSKDNIEFALDYNKENEVIDFDKLFGAFFTSPVDIDRTTKKYDANKNREQSLFFERLGEWVKEQNNSYLTYALINNYYPASPHASFRKANGLREASVNGNELIFENESQNEMLDFKDLKEREQQFISQSDNRASYDYQHKLRTMGYKIEDQCRKAIREFRNAEVNKSEHLSDVLNFHSSAYVLKRNENGNSTSTLKKEAKADLFTKMMGKVRESVNDQGASAVFAHASKDDLLPFDLMSSPYLSKMVSDDVRFGKTLDFRRDLFASFLDSDIAEPFFENKDKCYQPCQINGKNAYYNGDVIGSKTTPRTIMTEVLPEDLSEQLNASNYPKDEDFIDLLKMNERFKSPFNSPEEKLKVQSEFAMTPAPEPKIDETENDLKSYINNKKQEESKVSNNDSAKPENNGPVDPNGKVDGKDKKKTKNDRQMRLF